MATQPKKSGEKLTKEQEYMKPIPSQAEGSEETVKEDLAYRDRKGKQAA